MLNRYNGCQIGENCPCKCTGCSGTAFKPSSSQSPLAERIWPSSCRTNASVPVLLEPVRSPGAQRADGPADGFLSGTRICCAEQIFRSSNDSRRISSLAGVHFNALLCLLLAVSFSILKLVMRYWKWVIQRCTITFSNTNGIGCRSCSGISFPSDTLADHHQNWHTIQDPFAFTSRCWEKPLVGKGKTSTKGGRK